MYFIDVPDAPIEEVGGLEMDNKLNAPVGRAG